MDLPTTAQVNAATRNVASFAAGAVVMFGLGTKINPDTLTAIVNSTGALVNNLITLIGLITPAVAAYLASRASSPKAQIAAVAANPEVKQVITTPAIANSPELLDNEKVVAK